MGCPCLPAYCGITAHFQCATAPANASHRVWIVAGVTGGRSTRVTMAASRPRFKTSCKPTCRELNCPRSGAGLMTRDAPAAYTVGAIEEAFFPATTMTRSVGSDKDSMAAERNVPAVPAPSALGGQGKSALSVPIRRESPAARITPHRLKARLMPRRYQKGKGKSEAISLWTKRVSVGQFGG